ncbi:MAG TPA: peptidylprolyl isomerase [Terriglobales bacterium]|nr:peptidylprolyl isomerase [Terriglobales bacterium]
MRRLAFLVLLSLIAVSGTAQTKPATKAAPGNSAAPTSNSPKAIIDTTAGQITCTLFPDKAPMTVDNFIGLATGTKEWTNPVSKAKKRNTPLYDGTIFHRVIPGFMIQGGDPMGNGAGDPGYSFKDEFSDLRFDRPGRLAMANSGPNTNGSQFFITDVPTPHLNGRHTIFGQCGPLTVIKKIANVPRDPNDKPFKPVRISHVTIVKPGQTAPVAKPATKGPRG